MTSISGEFCILDNNSFDEFRAKHLSRKDPVYRKLKTKGFLYDNEPLHLELLSSRLWTKKSFLQGFTKLHIFVLTLRCNSSCVYCQATRQAENASFHYDMNVETARKFVDLMMKSPSPAITVEFQGGEPLLNYQVLKEVVLYSKELNRTIGKQLDYVVCTNLSLLNAEMIDFFKKEGVKISTSLDGPEFLHDSNRCRSIKDASYSVVVKKIIESQEALGAGSVSALMTTTKLSLNYSREIVDEYLKLKLGSIFIRSLNPYGYAVKTKNSIGYSVDEFVEFYKKCFEYIVEINKEGRVFPEAYAGLLFRKILTPWTVGFVDLQSPTGNGFAVTVYNYDGDVYASDESRMLHEMGDNSFRLGSVLTDTYEDIYFGSTMQLLAVNGVAECLAGCSDCVYVPYCGADPVRHYVTQHDAYGNRASSSFCEKNRQIFDYLFRFLESCSEEEENIVWCWLRNASKEEVDFPKVSTCLEK